VTNRSIAHARLRNSRLVGPPLATPEDVVGWFGAVQSQDVPGALWGLAQRLARGATIDDVGAAMDAGRLIRTHGPRPTWHFVSPPDLRWILALVGPRVQVQNGSINRREGVDEATLRRVPGILRTALAGGVAMTRPELRAALTAAGIEDARGLRLGLMGMHAELEAVLCNGPRRGRQATFMLVHDRVPPAPSRSHPDALRELTIRYFRSHGPALAHDMAWWSGLTVGSVREGIALAGDALEGRRIDGKDYWAAADAFDPEPGRVPEPSVLLLPNYDEYLGSFVDYSPIFDDALPKPRNVSDVLGAHIVVRDGLVVGGWRRSLGREAVTVTVTLLIPLNGAELAGLEAAAAAFGRFVGLPVDLQVTVAAVA
jgi:hypothetical protein